MHTRATGPLQCLSAFSLIQKFHKICTKQLQGVPKWHLHKPYAIKHLTQTHIHTYTNAHAYAYSYTHQHHNVCIHWSCATRTCTSLLCNHFKLLGFWHQNPFAVCVLDREFHSIFVDKRFLFTESSRTLPNSPPKGANPFFPVENAWMLCQRLLHWSYLYQWRNRRLCLPIPSDLHTEAHSLQWYCEPGFRQGASGTIHISEPDTKQRAQRELLH